MATICPDCGTKLDPMRDATAHTATGETLCVRCLDLRADCDDAARIAGDRRRINRARINALRLLETIAAKPGKAGEKARAFLEKLRKGGR